MKIVILVILAIALLTGGFFALWQAGENADAESCKQKYGPRYTLWHSPANSSVKACKAPDGSLKSS